MFLPTRLIVLIVLGSYCAIPACVAEETLNIAELADRHRNSIGRADILAAAKSRVIEGNASYRVLVGGTGRFDGKGVFVSEGARSHILLKLHAPQYAGERLVSDGNKTSVEGTLLNKNRSDLGMLLYSENVPLRDGLLGGVLTTAWPLLNLEVRKGKFQYQGVKKVDGVDLHMVTYQPYSRTNFEVSLYFEPNTFRHVLTVYKATQSAALGGPGPVYIPPPQKRTMNIQPPGADVRAATQKPATWEIEERFSDFRTTDGLTLPSHYNLRFREQSHRGEITLVEWEVTTTRVLNGVSVDERNFQIP